MINSLHLAYRQHSTESLLHDQKTILFICKLKIIKHDVILHYDVLLKYIRFIV